MMEAIPLKVKRSWSIAELELISRRLKLNQKVEIEKRLKKFDKPVEFQLLVYSSYNIFPINKTLLNAYFLNNPL
jgi:hypothetical protein